MSFALILPLMLFQGPIGRRIVAIAFNVGLLFMGEFIAVAVFTLYASELSFRQFAEECVVPVLAMRLVYLAISAHARSCVWDSVDPAPHCGKPAQRRQASGMTRT